MRTKVKHLVVDTSAFIKNAQLQEFGNNIVTIEEVIEEVRCSRQIQKLAVLPYELQVKDVDPECIAFVTNFAKKTGDYLHLSSTDIKLMALVYQMEKELIGIDHLRKEPVVSRVIEAQQPVESHAVPGFYVPDREETNCENDSTTDPDDDDDDDDDEDEDKDDSDNNLQEVPDLDTEVILEKFSHLSCNVLQQKNENSETEGNSRILAEEVDVQNNESDELDACVTDSDAAGWITPHNLRTKILDESSESNELIVGCLTTDFSMQNVLKQLGLNVISLDGMLINEIRTFVLRCYACFQIVPQTTRLFCPKCGNKTLKRVSVKVDSNGKQHVQINFRRPLTARGKKFPIPRPKGGKHSVNPILCEDQRVPQQRLSKLALTKNNPMHPDYIAGASPFVMRDVTSKSAILNGINKMEVKYWMRKNPNEVVKRRRTKR